MPKWVGRLGAVAAASVGLMGVATAARAATPAVSMDAATTAVTPPSGCSANSVKVATLPDGSYHGHLQATCDKRGQFYVSRDPAGKWALRSTAIDLPIPYAIAGDNTGTSESVPTTISCFYAATATAHCPLCTFWRSPTGSISCGSSAPSDSGLNLAYGSTLVARAAALHS